MSTSTQLASFKKAMETVYGPFESLSTEQAAEWHPTTKSGAHRGRYLWTDAFGVLNFLTLYKETEDQNYIALADNLFRCVHSILGYDRAGNVRLPGC